VPDTKKRTTRVLGANVVVESETRPQFAWIEEQSGGTETFVVRLSHLSRAEHSRASSVKDRLEIAARGLPHLDLFEAFTDFLEEVLSADGATEPSGRELTQGQRDALESVGSYVEEMPPVPQRVSVTTRLRGAQLRAQSLTTAQVADLLEVTPGRIRQRAADRSLYSIQVEGKARFPAFQFLSLAPGLAASRRELPGWSEIAPAIPEHAHPLAVEHVLHHVSEELEVDDELVSPADWLASGGSAAEAADVIAQALTLDA